MKQFRNFVGISKNPLLFLMVLSASLSLTAQDLQYSQFNAMPLALNPAFAGNNYCNYRISAIYRNQWMGSKDFKAYQSGSVAGDFNIGRSSNNLANLWGGGIIATFDQTKSNTYANLSILGNIAYHLRFGKDANNFLSFGLQAGVAQRSLNANNLTFNDQIDNYGQVISPTSEPFIADRKIYPEMNFGTLLTLNPTSTLNMYVGASAFHLLQPNISFTGQDYTLPVRFNVHAGANQVMGDWYFLPSFYFQYQQLANFNAGAFIGRTLKYETENTMPIIGYLGVWYKSTDAIAFALRMDLAALSIIASYDLHVGQISNNQGSIGSPEISVNYFGCFGRNSRRTGCPLL